MPRKKKTDSEETLETEDTETVESDPKEKKVKKEKKSSEAEDKLSKLKEKAKKLAESIKTSEDESLKEKVKPSDEKKENLLVPIEDYLKSSIHLGTRAITPDMRPYVYKRRADSLAVFNTTLLDQKIREGAEYLSKFAPSEVIVVCKRDAGIKAVELFSKATGIKCFVKNYPAGVLTNPKLDTFIESDLVFICDPWIDKSAVADARRIKIPVLAICDTNNYTSHINKIIPGNNKSAKSLGMIFYLLTKMYIENRKLDAEIPKVSDFIEGWENLQPPK